MSPLNWITLILAVGVHLACQTIGSQVAMSSSYENSDDGNQSRYLDRVQFATGIAQFGALFAFVTQLIPIQAVQTAGIITLVIAIIALLLVRAGLLYTGLSPDDNTGAD